MTTYTQPPSTGSRFAETSRVTIETSGAPHGICQAAFPDSSQATSFPADAWLARSRLERVNAHERKETKGKSGRRRAEVVFAVVGSVYPESAQ